jgi:hypothetical protein
VSDAARREGGNVLKLDESATKAVAGFAEAAAKPQEIFDLTWSWGTGPQLAPWQAAQRLYLAGWTDAKELAVAWAVMEAESGGYVKAWHHNVRRDEDGMVALDDQGHMTVLSTDLGFVQRNVVHNGQVGVKVEFMEDASQEFVAWLFERNPSLALGSESAAVGYAMWETREWAPWVAYRNGSYRRSLPRGCEAVANYLGKVLLNDATLVRRLDA